jgi:hypothetical protein
MSAVKCDKTEYTCHVIPTYAVIILFAPSLCLVFSQKIPRKFYHGWGQVVVQLVEALRYKLEGHGFKSQWCY